MALQIWIDMVNRFSEMSRKPDLSEMSVCLSVDLYVGVSSYIPDNILRKSFPITLDFLGYLNKDTLGPSGIFDL